MSDGWPICACGNVLSPENLRVERLSGVVEVLCSNVSCALKSVAKVESGPKVVRFLEGFNELLFGYDEGTERIKRLETTLQRILSNVR
ncbi:MAG: hypothetical protein NZ988_01735 [Thaumarchaeota archaeon]|nr:hypothetical protein [Candidatus Calditenuaceae archaeon]MDW8186756.1 hypothetical protein [Nitrososphaerota archaeon]